MSLLEKAKAVATGKERRLHTPTDEEYELAASYFRGEVSVMQVSVVLACARQNVASWATSTVRKGIASGRLSLRVAK